MRTTQLARSQLDKKVVNPRILRALRKCCEADITLIERGDTIESERLQIRNVVTSMIDREK